MADIQFQVLYFLPKCSQSGKHLTFREMRLSSNVGDGRSAVGRLTGAACIRGPRGVRSWNACTRVTVEEYTGISVAPQH